ncbi:hypothetical protein DAEQUDRAFT_770883 [Daedalea quercina L-15889]|uniref:Uncharacterized protein n=1 Tax=Daedalea quercina L-15889 TaxID=1314783 RepID=A0A165KHD5_9APHY|nr:hypothetical protein DAEQUDRAFT_770883 [Daedalea quercina L-15889]
MVDLQHRLAMTLIAAMFTQLLYGVALSQAIYYFWVYREDSQRYKYLVAWWLLLDTVKTGAALQAVFAEIVFTHGNNKVVGLGIAPV